VIFTRARFTNFRALRDLDLEFSVDPQKPITVIRAENATGKTTILVALQWAFFGDEALPDGGRDYRLHPIDWDLSQSTRVPISVEVDFEVDNTGSGSGIDQYRLIRSCTEEIGSDNSWHRSAAEPDLFEVGSKGTQKVPNPERRIEDLFPRNLKEVFFTDGDRAMTFIEADATLATKRRRVQNAIRALLGLDILEDAVEHISGARDSFNKQLKQNTADESLKRITDRLSDLKQELQIAKQAKESAESGLANVDAMRSQTLQDLEAALMKGNEEELKRELNQVSGAISRNESLLDELKKQHSELFRDNAIGTALISAQMAKAAELLFGLTERGTIPRNFIPILTERLKMGICICGESLKPGEPRRTHFEHLLEDEKKADEVGDRLTQLHYVADRLVGERAADKNRWLEALANIERTRQAAKTALSEAQARAKELDEKLKVLGRTDVDALRERRQELDRQRAKLIDDRSRSDSNVGRLTKELLDTQQQQFAYLRLKDKYLKQTSHLLAASDLEQVVKEAITTIQVTKVTAVSQSMNDYFISMIGASDHTSAVVRTEITPEFDIVVYGPQQRLLSPDRDLSGAQRRALTLAFILALTTVSEVDAPSVIDTPLGMMDPQVKREVLKTTAGEFNQLILFLTRSEIRDVEDLLDRYAGVVITLSNAGHFPVFLKNDPGTSERRVIRCNCNHRESCRVCERTPITEEKLRVVEGVA
jgi:DNA sulfur modification protein DndD